MVTPADAIVKAVQELAWALQSKSNLIGNAHMEALKQMAWLNAQDVAAKPT